MRLVIGLSVEPRKVQACPVCGKDTPALSGPWMEIAETGQPICQECSHSAPLFAHMLMLYWKDRERAEAALDLNPRVAQAG